MKEVNDYIWFLTQEISFCYDNSWCFDFIGCYNEIYDYCMKTHKGPKHHEYRCRYGVLYIDDEYIGKIAIPKISLKYM